MTQNPAIPRSNGNHAATVLLVDDDDDTVATFSEILREEGYVVLGASNGKDALHVVQREPRPDVVLLDWSMPVMGGRAFLDAVREDARFAELPIIVLSADVNRTPHGAMRAIQKPLGLADLTKLFGWLEELVGTRTVPQSAAT